MVNLNLVINRGQVVSFDALPQKSIALDGYCQGPAVDVEGQKFSFDHHDNCLRLVTKATCGQVLDALLLGLDPNDFTVYINDIDGDTTLAYWLLQNPSRVAEEKVRSLVENVGNVDAHGPAYPVTDSVLTDNFYQGVMKEVSDARRNKTYGTDDLQTLLENAINNIDKLLAGELEATRDDKPRTYEVTHKGNGWAMVKSDDFIFDLLYKDGINKAVAYKEMNDESFAYTVGKKSELVAWPVGPMSKEGTILFTLNTKESGWGGGSTIGGAPRNADGSRSHLTPDEIFQIIQSVL